MIALIEVGRDSPTATIRPQMKLFAAIFALLLAVFLLENSFDYKLSAKLKSHKTSDIEPKAYTSSLIIKGSSGIGVFKDIQVPVNNDLQSRGDGTLTKTEFQDHAGFPLSLAVRYATVFGSFRWSNGGELLSISASSGPIETQSSSYGRISLSSDFDYLFLVGSMNAFVGSKLEARRTSFNNLSNGHHVNSGIVGLRAGLEKHLSYKFQGFAGIAPVSEFRYHDTNSFAGNRMKSSSTEMAELGLEASFNLHKNAWLDIGFEQEYLLVHIDDVSEYDSFGLAVTPTSLPNRVYDFETTILKLGFHKSF